MFDDRIALKSILGQLQRLSTSLDVVVADGDRSDATRDICRGYGATWVPSPRGRGAQMNRGASMSNGDILWFLHADSIVHPSSLAAIESVMKDRRKAGGAFRFRLHQRHWYAPLLDFGVWFRSRGLKLPYGDQGFFVRRSVFDSIGGYEEIPFLEDVRFASRLREYGGPVILPVTIGVSARRWERDGFLYSTARNWLIVMAYSLGASPERLANWYRPEKTESMQKRRIVRFRPARVGRRTVPNKPWVNR